MSNSLGGFYAIEKNNEGLNAVPIFSPEDLENWSAHFISLANDMGEKFAQEKVISQIENAFAEYVTQKNAAGIDVTFHVPSLSEAKDYILDINKRYKDFIGNTGW